MRRSLSMLTLAFGLAACSGDTTVTQNPPEDTGVADTVSSDDTSEAETAAPDTVTIDTSEPTDTADPVDTSEPADTLSVGCTTACEPWQTCGDDGQCHDTPCVLGQSALGACILQ